MGLLADARTESAFPDARPAMTADQAAVEAHRCLYCHDAPCMNACPTHIDVAQFIRKISTGNLRGAARTIFDANVLGASCARACPVEVLCEGACVYHEKGVAPIQIGRLQRHASEAAARNGWRFAVAGPDTGRRVALVGGGPASLACAHELRVLGHACTVFEKRPILGGLDTTGIAPYKLPAADALAEVDYLLGIGGIEVRLGVEVGRDVELERLERDYDAVFLGVGLGPDSRLGVPGADLLGVEGAVDWIERMKLGAVALEGVRHAVVVGGGNTAMDAVRELAGLGVPSVRLVYRGDAGSMSGYAHEWEKAKSAGVVAAWNTVPVALLGSGRVQAVRLARTDADKHRLPGTEHELPADLVLLAIGQSRLGELVGALSGFTLDRGRVVVDGEGYTGRPRWWAGGDCANGGKEVVDAVAAGKAAARAIDGFLTGRARG